MNSVLVFLPSDVVSSHISALPKLNVSMSLNAPPRKVGRNIYLSLIPSASPPSSTDGWKWFPITSENSIMADNIGRGWVLMLVPLSNPDPRVWGGKLESSSAALLRKGRGSVKVFKFVFFSRKQKMFFFFFFYLSELLCVAPRRIKTQKLGFCGSVKCSFMSRKP